MSSVAVIDYGMGNLHSIVKALQCADSQTRVVIAREPEQTFFADRIVFPGVGAMRDCMLTLHERGWLPVIRKLVEEKPFLGICLGMQALLDASEENEGVTCLGLLPGKVVRFPESLTDDRGTPLKTPHMGWNRVHQAREHPVWAGIPQDSRFYFVHSYYACPTSSQHITAISHYPAAFTAALASGKVFAVQFHPEKSQAMGLRLLANFLGWNPGE